MKYTEIALALGVFFVFAVFILPLAFFIIPALVEGLFDRIDRRLHKEDIEVINESKHEDEKARVKLEAN